MGLKRTADGLSSRLRRYDLAALYDIGEDRPRIATRRARTDRDNHSRQLYAIARLPIYAMARYKYR